VYYYLVGVAGKTQQLTTVYKVKTRWLEIHISHSTLHLLKGIVQPFELGGETTLIRSAVKNWKAGMFVKKFLMIPSHERSIKPFSAA
jgi:hypothetical protein